VRSLPSLRSLPPFMVSRAQDLGGGGERSVSPSVREASDCQ
jgi:hypothetical protein